MCVCVCVCAFRETRELMIVFGLASTRGFASEHMAANEFLVFRVDSTDVLRGRI